VKNRLLEIRLSRGIKKQKDFAEFLGISSKDYNLLENNKKGISLDNAIAIAKKLNMSIEDIWFED